MFLFFTFFLAVAWRPCLQKPRRLWIRISTSGFIYPQEATKGCLQDPSDFQEEKASLLFWNRDVMRSECLSS
ncbi:MAG TPA: hypothetical protein DCE42_25140 [Myxococcales bacterium]|nr:hypothetical protein [Deltaproteobacteria bacterium]HAA58072.1 hypothetical protein [Myxococcales bacterium]